MSIPQSTFSSGMVSVSIATAGDAADLARLRCAAANHLIQKHGHGPWSGLSTERGVLYGIKTSRVLVARDADGIVGTLRLATKKPWAIDTRYFATVRRALYLLDMAVDPRVQRHGIGRCLLDHARAVTREWPADAIRLDAYDAVAGAGPFYAKCGFRDVAHVSFRGVPLVYYELLL